MDLVLLHEIAMKNADLNDFKKEVADKIGFDTKNETDMSRLEDYRLIDDSYNQLQFIVDKFGIMEFEEGFNYRTDIVERSELVFDTPIIKSNISTFATGNRRNVTMAYIFKICVVLNCSPNDLYHWQDWRGKVMRVMEDSNQKITNDQIKELL